MDASRITRDVVLDLLPAVRSGTASAESRQIVESFLAKDPEFAARVATMPFPSAELEMQALHRTRGRIKRGGLALPCPTARIPPMPSLAICFSSRMRTSRPTSRARS